MLTTWFLLCHKGCVVSKILAMKYCNPVMRVSIKKKKSCALLVSLNHKHSAWGIETVVFSEHGFL